MLVHIIIDYSFLYYKYKFALDSGRMTRLSAPFDVGGVMIERDISQIYYSLREIEGFRKDWEKAGHDVVISVCFDMPTDRKKSGEAGAEKYKSNRTKLGDTDFENIGIVKSILDEAGYNTYKYDGYEADDLIYHLVNATSDKFNATIIVTPDADVLVNIKPGVVGHRYKSSKGYTAVTVDNFEKYLSEEMKCTVPYNSLMLFKCTVGDKSDCIDGIKKFGPKAFDKLVSYLNTLGINWSACGTYEATKSILTKLGEVGYFDSDKLSQAEASLNLVRPKIVTFDMPFPANKSDGDKRCKAYMKYNMRSLTI